MRPRGFTLIELIFVVLILAIVLVSTLPGFLRTSQRLRVEHTAFEFAQLLRVAREHAVTSGRTITWTWSDDDRRAQLAMLDEQGDAQLLEDRFSRSATVPREVEIQLQRDEDDIEAIAFFPDGTTDTSLAGAAQSTQVFVRAPGTVYTVIVDAATGHASVFQGEPGPQGPQGLAGPAPR